MKSIYSIVLFSTVILLGIILSGCPADATFTPDAKSTLCYLSSEKTEFHEVSYHYKGTSKLHFTIQTIPPETKGDTTFYSYDASTNKLIEINGPGFTYKLSHTIDSVIVECFFGSSLNETITYVLDENSVVSATRLRNGSSFPNRTYTYTVVNQLVTTMVVQLDDNEDGVIDETRTAVYGYDSKPNPFYRHEGRWLNPDNVSPFSRNNVLSESNSSDNGQSGVTNYSIMYNDYGYPSSILIGTYGSTFEYICP